MKTNLVTLLMVLGLATVSFAAGAEDELKAVEQQWIDAYMKNDGAFIKNLEADDYALIESDGTVTTKAQDVKGTTDKTFVLKSATFSDMKVRMIGTDCAVVTAMLKMSGTEEGKEFSGDYRGTDVFEKKGGKWMAVASQLTKVHKE
jgi:hypothetical protein